MKKICSLILALILTLSMFTVFPAAYSDEEITLTAIPNNNETAENTFVWGETAVIKGTSVKIYEDLLMNFYLFRRIQLGVFEDFCPYHYMLRSGSTMVSVLNANKLRDPIKVSHILEKETAGDLDWQMPVERRLMYQLVCNATLGLGDQKELIKPIRKEVRKELRQRLWKTLFGKKNRRRIL